MAFVAPMMLDMDAWERSEYTSKDRGENQDATS
jgi:hypothetical protein